MSAMYVWPFVGLAFCTWAVSLAAIAALQQQCSDEISLELSAVNGFSSDMPCKNVYRYYWFIVALEFVIITMYVGTLASGMFHKLRIGLVGLLSVVTLLYIGMTDTFLTAGSLPSFYSGSSSNRLKTMIAGSLMTATANCFLILAAGYECECKAKEIVEKEIAEKAAV